MGVTQRSRLVRATSFASLGITSVALWLGLAACAPKPEDPPAAATTTAERAACVATSPSPNYTITGTAVYNRRVFLAQSSGGGLGGVDTDGNNGAGGGTAWGYPIRYAEVEVLNEAGTVVQCGQTDTSGNFSLTVPRSSNTYTFRVNSRSSDSAHVLVSVLDNPTSNNVYSLSTTFIPNASKSIGTVTASVTGTLLGGVFNIYDQILKANEFLAAKTADCATFQTGCVPYTPNYKCSVYWTKGFNPGTYVGTTSGLSFYLPGKSELYILGGSSGAVDSVDTDHFDNSVIIHEYGHFIEDKYSKTDSPGGYHSGSKVIDPRLAWSEGWANFFASAVTSDPIYRDTLGNSTSTTRYLFYRDLTSPQSGEDYPITRAGEGNFREFAVSRSLYAVNVLTATPAHKFNELWATFTGSFRSYGANFRNYGLFMEKHAAITGGSATVTDFSAQLAANFQRADRQDYDRVVATGSCSDVTINYIASPTDWLANTDTYEFYHSGGALNLELFGMSGSVDLDIYLFKDGYKFIYESTSCSGNLCMGEDSLVAKSDATIVTGSTSGTNTEIINTTAAAGYYHIIINAYSSSSGTATYKINTNGSRLCVQ